MGGLSWQDRGGLWWLTRKWGQLWSQLGTPPFKAETVGGRGHIRWTGLTRCSACRGPDPGSGTAFRRLRGQTGQAWEDRGRPSVLGLASQLLEATDRQLPALRVSRPLPPPCSPSLRPHLDERSDRRLGLGGRGGFSGLCSRSPSGHSTVMPSPPEALLLVEVFRRWVRSDMLEDRECSVL